MGLDQEIADSHHGRLHRVMDRLRRFMQHHALLLALYRLLVITLGFLCIVAGIIMLVTPGPGWLFIFIGMSLWGTEFHWAHRLNVWAKAKVLGIWWEIEARRDKRRRTRRNTLWKRRGCTYHYCPNGSHYSTKR